MSDVGEKRENPDGGSQPNRKRKKVRFLRRARRPVAEGTPRGTRGPERKPPPPPPADTIMMRADAFVSTRR
jgi:hypothetical protein